MKFNDKLILSGDLFKNKTVVICQNGIENGLRKKKDGHCYFGTAAAVDRNGKMLNDYIVNLKEDDQECNRLFEIVYDKMEMKFKLNFIHTTYSLFCEISSDYDFYFESYKNVNLLFGKINAMIYPKLVGDKNTIDISIVINGAVEHFSFWEYAMPITIGRTNCSINIKDKSISKTHGVLYFCREKQQFFFRDNNSTNKTHLILRKDDSCIIEHQMDCKIKDSKFNINLIK